MLKVGDKAPNFEGINQDGKNIELSQLLDDSKLILFFYPKDSTPGCTAEACDLNHHLAWLIEEGFKVVGISADSIKRHQNFIAKNGLGFDLIADTEMEIINLFGCWGTKKFMGRVYDGILRKTFVINQDGIIERIFEKVITKEHTKQIMETYDLEVVRK